MLNFVAERLVLHFINYGECREKGESVPPRKQRNNAGHAVIVVI